MFPLHPPRVPSAYPPPYGEFDPSPAPPTPPPPEFTPNPDLLLRSAPPLDPAWIAYEATLPAVSHASSASTESPQETYSKSCKTINAHLLSGIYSSLNHGIKIHDSFLDDRPNLDALFPIQQAPTSRGRRLTIRSYSPESSLPDAPSVYFTKRPPGSAEQEEEEAKDIIIYYHGGGLYVGDLDSEDLTCRRLCKELGCTVYSVNYRLMPEFSADDAVFDAMNAFRQITSMRRARRLIVMGSSSGAQLAAMVASQCRVWGGLSSQSRGKIHGVCLRGPVLCDATEDGANLPPQLRKWHTSMSERFHTSLLSSAAVNAANRTTSKMPLEAETWEGLPRHWIQVCTNDIYYSDGVLYGECLREAGVDVRMDVLRGWPHTFWLKAPELEKAVQAEKDCVEGVRWLLESEVVEDKEEARLLGV